MMDHDPDLRACRAVGDNLAVVRYGAGAARLRRPDIHAHLETGLGRALAAGWRLDLQAVRRRLNGTADALAPQGVRWAAQLRAGGETGLRTRAAWAPEAAAHRAPPPPPHLAALAGGREGVCALGMCRHLVQVLLVTLHDDSGVLVHLRRGGRRERGGEGAAGYS